MLDPGAPRQLSGRTGGVVRRIAHGGRLGGRAATGCVSPRAAYHRAGMTTTISHPLAPLAGEEIEAARRMVFESGRLPCPVEPVRFAYVGLCDPPKSLVHAYDRGEEVAVDRRVRL